MAINSGARFYTIMMCFGLIVLTGCGNFLKPEIGAVAHKESRIALVDGDTAKGIWQSGDLHVTYALAQKGEIFTLTGKIFFNRSITDSFPIITKFFFYLSYLDDAGKVIETVDISPVIPTFGSIPESLPLKFSGVRPPGSKTFVFHYYGGVRASSRGEGDQWDVYHFPFN
jgi:hypothetical protein